MRVLGIAAAIAVLFGAAHAATISVTNGDFEAGGPLVEGAAQTGADGWTHQGTAGVFQPNMTAGATYNSPPAELNEQVGFLYGGGKFYQLLDATLEDGASYTLSAYFGDPLAALGGVTGWFGFFAGSPTNLIATQAITAPGSGEWSIQSLSILSADHSQYIGETLGVVFFNSGLFWSASRFNIDLVSVTSSGGSIRGQEDPIDDVEVLSTPIPGALPLMLTGMLGGWFASRRKRQAA